MPTRASRGRTYKAQSSWGAHVVVVTHRCVDVCASRSWVRGWHSGQNLSRSCKRPWSGDFLWAGAWGDVRGPGPTEGQALSALCAPVGVKVRSAEWLVELAAEIREILMTKVCAAGGHRDPSPGRGRACLSQGCQVHDRQTRVAGCPHSVSAGSVRAIRTVQRPPEARAAVEAVLGEGPPRFRKSRSLPFLPVVPLRSRPGPHPSSPARRKRHK